MKNEKSCGGRCRVHDIEGMELEKLSYNQKNMVERDGCLVGSCMTVI